jgi:hypothetical protein
MSKFIKEMPKEERFGNCAALFMALFAMVLFSSIISLLKVGVAVSLAIGSVPALLILTYRFYDLWSTYKNSPENGPRRLTYDYLPDLRTMQKMEEREKKLKEAQKDKAYVSRFISGMVPKRKQPMNMYISPFLQ